MSGDEALQQLLAAPPYGLPQPRKREILTARVRALVRHHHAHCATYRDVIERLFGGRCALEVETLEDAPFLPVSLFKTRELRSVDAGAVVKTMTSSGTTGSAVSRIYLDGPTAQLQQQVLVKIMQHFLGVERRPLVFVDHPGVIRDRAQFAARGAGILGMLPFGRKPFYALREDMSLDLEGLEAYLAASATQPPVFFGFTFMVWQHFVQALEAQGRTLSIEKAVLLHSGGWKKLEALKVSPDEFRVRVQRATGIDRVLNYYGMVEQVGSVYLEDPLHHLHASNFSEVIIRDPHTLEPLPLGQPGLIQVVSALPTSYPGHSLLTEDMGVLETCDDPATGMHGRGFRILGRVPKAELRGCSDTFQQPAVAAA